MIRVISRFTCSSTMPGKWSSSHCLRIGFSMSRTISSSGFTCGRAGTVAAIVEREFPAYDGNSDGQLDKAEFSRWMVALKDQELKASGKTMPPTDVTAWVDGAFVTADADKSVTISKPELISYLNGGAT